MKPTLYQTILAAAAGSLLIGLLIRRLRRRRKLVTEHGTCEVWAKLPAELRERAVFSANNSDAFLKSAHEWLVKQYKNPPPTVPQGWPDHLKPDAPAGTVQPPVF